MRLSIQIRPRKPISKKIPELRVEKTIPNYKGATYLIQCTDRRHLTPWLFHIFDLFDNGYGSEMFRPLIIKKACGSVEIPWLLSEFWFVLDLFRFLTEWPCRPYKRKIDFGIIIITNAKFNAVDRSSISARSLPSLMFECEKNCVFKTLLL